MYVCFMVVRSSRAKTIYFIEISSSFFKTPVSLDRDSRNYTTGHGREKFCFQEKLAKPIVENPMWLYPHLVAEFREYRRRRTLLMENGNGNFGTEKINKL